MPGFDGTGPRGQGTITGWGRGYCALPLAGGAGRPFFGRGFWRNGGRRGHRNRFWTTGLAAQERIGFGHPSFGTYSRIPEMTLNQEMEMLKQDAELLKAQLEDIQNRIETLEKTEKTSKSDN